MKNKLPWVICVILALLLLVTNLPRGFFQSQPAVSQQWTPWGTRFKDQPVDLLDAGDHTAAWSIYRDEGWADCLKALSNDVADWVRSSPSGNPKKTDCLGHALTFDDQYVAYVYDGDCPTVHVLQNGREIAALPFSNSTYDSARRFNIFDANRVFQHQLWDKDGDGVVDTKWGSEKFWIYKHGHFLPADPNTKNNLHVQLLNGDLVTLHNGRWIPVSEGSVDAIQLDSRTSTR